MAKKAGNQLSKFEESSNDTNLEGENIEEQEYFEADAEDGDVDHDDGSPNNECPAFSPLTVTEPKHQLSLEFRCANTIPSQRKLCKSLWKAIYLNPELDRIMARGWSEKENFPEPSITNVNEPATPTACDELQNFLDHNVDSMVLSNGESRRSVCVPSVTSQDSLRLLLTDIETFDVNVKTEYSIPPKAPKPTRSQIKEEHPEQKTSKANSIEQGNLPCYLK